MVTLEYLLNNIFSSLSPSKQIEIKNKVNPNLDLNILQISKSSSR